MELTIKQTIALDYAEDKVTSEIIFGGAAGGGKSALGCYWVLKNCFKYAGSRWLIGRAKLKTLKETTLNTFFEICKIQGISADMYVYNQQSGTIRFNNGSEILLKDLFYYPSDPNFDELGSLEITGAFIDEINQITEKAKQIVMSRIRYKLDWFGLIPKLFGSCNPAKNWVYTQFYEPYKKGTLIERRKFVQALATDNPHLSAHYIENLKMLDEPSKQRLLYGNWDYDDNIDALIDFDSTNDYFTNEHVKPTGRKCITADIARKGRDTTVVRVWDGFVVIERRSLKVSLVNESVYLIRSLATKYSIPMSSVVVDEDGVGGGVRDYLRCYGFVNNSKPIGRTNYTNLKSQCSFIMANLIKEKKVYEVCTSEDIKARVRRELGAVRQANIDNDGKVGIRSKEDMKNELGSSPDEWDSIMMRAFFELGQRY
jgi:PBSX family phage terminase large subunit